MASSNGKCPNIKFDIGKLHENWVCLHKGQTNPNKLSTKDFFTKSFMITEGIPFGLEEPFSYPHWVNLIDKAREDVTYWALHSVWRKLCPECVTDHDFEGSDVQVMKSVLMANSTVCVWPSVMQKKELVKVHKAHDSGKSCYTPKWKVPLRNRKTG